MDGYAGIRQAAVKAGSIAQVVTIAPAPEL
jgi:hypothetical protein